MRNKINFCRPENIKASVDGCHLAITKSESDDETTFNIQGVIGDAWDGLSAMQVVDEIQNAKGAIRMRLNTPGGAVFEALDIYDALVEHPHQVTADIVSQAWSAGTILTAAADVVRIRPAARYGMHRAWSGFLLMGNAEELREQTAQLEANCELLDKLDAQIAGFIAKRSGNTVDQVMEWMVGPDGVDGTEFVGQEAVDKGFADSLIETSPTTNKTRSQFEQAARSRALAMASLARS